jgi:hypothetical protein
MKKSLFLGTFFCLSFAQTAFAQVTAQFHDGRTFVIKGKEIYENDYYGKCYLDETPDTIHHYAHKIYEFGGVIVTHVRIPTRYFSKAESKITGANVKASYNKYNGPHMSVNFRCNKKSNIYLKNHTENEFLHTVYSSKIQPEEGKRCGFGIDFKDHKEAKAFVERMKALSKK